MGVKCGLQAGTPVNAIAIVIDDKKMPLLLKAIELIRATLPDKVSLQHLTSNLCTKIFLYWSVDQACHEKQTLYSDAELQ
jgi:hypothetical protein